MRSRRVSRSTALWNVTPNFVLEGSVTLADPEFTEETVLPGEDRRIHDHRAAARHCRCRRSGNTGYRPNTRSPTSWRGTATSGPVGPTTISRTPGRTSMQPSPGIRTRTSLPGRRATCSSVSAHNSGWDAALIIRNLFDEQGINWLSSDELRRVLRRSALPFHPHTAAAPHDQPVLHQEMVTARRHGLTPVPAFPRVRSTQ